ncbi:hypothetical protein [Haloterrigena gelatinilytica]|uniref:hypothetical protein n=1 Tax=Haloterrigena gelatinilytica TaxID=2741724 RepID=UPI001C2E8E34|nr:hypothetical protein [Haloterrigena gelatinilytica]
MVGVNEYYGDTDSIQRFQDDPECRSSSPRRAAVPSGATTGPKRTAGPEAQAEIDRGKTNALSDFEQITGMSPWILFDFRAPLWQNGYQRAYNRKGVVDQHGRKKQAFHVPREFYESEEL